MALIPIPLGPDRLLTQGNGPYADNNNFDNVASAGIIPMGNGVNILVFAIANPVTPFQSGTIARAFTVNTDGTQEWGNALQLGTDNTPGYGVAIDATRALVVYASTSTNMLVRVLSLSGLTLTAGATATVSVGGTLTGYNIGPRPFKVMDPTTVLFGFKATGTGRGVVRVQLIKVVGTTVTVDITNALNVHDGNTTSLSLIELCQIDKYTCAFFWNTASLGFASFFGYVQLDPTFSSMTDVGFGASQLYDGTTIKMLEFREMQFGFVLALGTRSPGSVPITEILEFNSLSHFLTNGPIVELTQTAPNPPVNAFFGLTMAGHQAVIITRRTPFGLGENYRAVEINLGAYAREIKEIGFVDFTLVPGVSGPNAGPTVALTPRRVLFLYAAGGSATTIEHAITIGVPIVDPLRWRQRDDCLTPGSATPCICFNLTPGVVCIPPWSLRLTTSVQFGGRVGTRNRYL